MMSKLYREWAGGAPRGRLVAAALVMVGLLGLAPAGRLGAEPPADMVSVEVKVLSPDGEEFKDLKIKSPVKFPAMARTVKWEPSADGAKYRRTVTLQPLDVKFTQIERFIATKSIEDNREKTVLKITPKVFRVRLRGKGVKLKGKNLKLLATAPAGVKPVPKAHYRFGREEGEYELALIPFGLGNITSVRVQLEDCVPATWAFDGNAVDIRPLPKVPEFEDITKRYPHLKGAARFVTEAEYLNPKRRLWSGPTVSSAAVDPSVGGKRLVVMPGFEPCLAKVDDNRVVLYDRRSGRYRRFGVVPDSFGPKYLDVQLEFDRNADYGWKKADLRMVWLAGGKQVASGGIRKAAFPGSGPVYYARFRLPDVYDEAAAQAKKGKAGEALAELEGATQFRVTQSGKKSEGELGFYPTLNMQVAGYPLGYKFQPNFEGKRAGGPSQGLLVRAFVSMAYYDLRVELGKVRRPPSMEKFRPQYSTRQPAGKGGDWGWRDFPDGAFNRTPRGFRLVPSRCPRPVFAVRISGPSGALVSKPLTDSGLKMSKEVSLEVLPAGLKIELPAGLPGAKNYRLWLSQGEKDWPFDGELKEDAKIKAEKLPKGWQDCRAELRIDGYRPLVVGKIGGYVIDAKDVEPAPESAVLIFTNWTEISVPKADVADAIGEYQSGAVRSLTELLKRDDAEVTGYALVPDNQGNVKINDSRRYFSFETGDAPVPPSKRRKLDGDQLWLSLRELLATKNVAELHPNLKVVVVTPYESLTGSKRDLSEAAKKARAWVEGRVKDFGLELHTVVVGDPASQFEESRFKRASKRYPGTLWMLACDSNKITVVRPKPEEDAKPLKSQQDVAEWLKENAVPKILD